MVKISDYPLLALSGA